MNRPFPIAAEHPLFQQWMNRGYEEDMGGYPAHLELYHYTSFAGALGILSTDTLWASDIRCLNDTTEFEHGLPRCVAALDRVDDPRLTPFVRPLGQSLRERFGHETFVVSLSMACDLEPQWERYGDHQRGYVVGFDNRCLSDVRGPRLMPVEYKAAAQDRRIRRAVERACEDALEQWRPRGHPLPYTFAGHARFSMLGAELFYHCATFKSAKWSIEREWRLIYTRQINDEGGLRINQMPDGRPYVIVDLRERHHPERAWPIYASVRAGPKANEAARVVRQVLTDRRISCRWERQRRF